MTEERCEQEEALGGTLARAVARPRVTDDPPEGWEREGDGEEVVHGVGGTRIYALRWRMADHHLTQRVPERPTARARRWWPLWLALAIGIAEPHVELAWKCRASFQSSEACVWGRAYLPLGRWLAPLVVTPIAFVVLIALSWAWRQWRGR
jgi:hypothetical protein